ncbi:11640_t:CDS:1, partial [Racocetra persica]
QLLISKEPIHSIQKIIQNLNNLDVNSLQVIYNQLSKVIENICSPNKTFQAGD